jgi:hypothetical protein
MNKKECDIIKDLLPSYVDNICSEASKEWIEAHLAECEACRATAEALKTTEFSVKQMDFAQVDATKKVKKKQIGSSLVVLSLCMFVMLVTAGIFAEGNSTVSHLVLYGELPICMVISWFTNRSRQAKRSWDKWDTFSLAAAVLATGYGIGVLFFMVLNGIGGNTILFGLELNEVGPLLSLQLTGCAVVCLVIYIIQMVRLYRNGSTNSVILSLCLMGIFLMLVYSASLGNLSDIESAVLQLKKATFTVLDVGLMGIAVLAFMDWRGNREK